MPICADLRRFYGREWREIVRPRILSRAGNRCEECRAPNRTVVYRARGWWRPVTIGAVWRRENGHLTTSEPLIEREVEIVLSVAHLNHCAGDDRDENLKALCQWCHLNYDKLHHHETRAARKDAARPLLNLTGSERRPIL